jgi:tripartite-type tricarboxylate transporter receptor subunit TctC
MKLPRRNFLHLAAGAAALLGISRMASAQAYPTRPINVIVTFNAGSAPDIIARLLGQRLSERLGQPFVIENRPGAGGNIGTEAVVRASPDGYTLLIVGGWNAINATLYDKLSFNFIRDIAPVAGIHREPYVIAVHPSVPAKTVPEFIAYAKANPGKVTMASGGIGAPSHVSGELFKMRPGSTWCMCPTAVGAQRLQTYSVVRCRSCSPPRLPRSSTSGLASCGRWR